MSRLLRPLIVGEAPSRTSDPETPITGSCGKRLAEFAGLTESEYRRRFARVNLLLSWPGLSGSKGTAFDVLAARDAATRLQTRLWSSTRSRFVVLLGHRVETAFALPRKRRYFAPHRVGRSVFVVVPHPSGINRWYNEPQNSAAMARFLRAIVEEPMNKSEVVNRLTAVSNREDVPEDVRVELVAIVEAIGVDLAHRETKRKVREERRVRRG